MDRTINIKGHLLSLGRPQVMGIVNATPDSFYAGSRKQTEEELAGRVQQIIAEGGTMIDVGGYSTRPDAAAVTQEEETERLRRALAVVRREAPEMPLSVDTFRPDVARMAVEEFGADLINDVGAPVGQAPQLDLMLKMVARLRVPYIFMSHASDIRGVLMESVDVANRLHSLGQNDLIVDPGFGFGKTLEQNYEVLRQLELLGLAGMPVLVGVSRKSMVYRLLGTSADAALNGTTVLHTVALQKGASILRVHDVREAVECVKIVESITNKE